MAEQTATTQPPKKSGRTLLLVGTALLLAASLGAAAWLFFRQKAVQVKQPEGAASRIAAVFPLEEFIVNLGDPEGDRFLRVGLELGLDHAVAGKESKEEAASPKPILRDTIIAILSTRKSDELLSDDGKARLKKDLLRALEDRVPGLGVKEIYFTDFLVQR
jgi:flagellar protein FliL